MRRFSMLLAAVAAVFAMQFALFDHAADAKRYRAGTVIGVGAAALVAGALIAGSSRSHAKPAYSCASLDRRCYNGSRWACKEFDRHC